jgi:CHAT domain-containing protein
LRIAQKNLDPTNKTKLTLAWELGDELRYVPMDALFDGKNYLVRSYSSAIFTATSLSTESHNGPLIAVAAGDSLGDHNLPDNWVASPLPNVVTEVRSLFYSKNTRHVHPDKIRATILLDDAAPPDAKFTTDNLQRALEELAHDPNTRAALQRPIIHIASHFVLNDTAASSFLLTRSGLLSLSTLADQERFPFRSAWLVTLSACETGAIRSAGNPGAQGQHPADGHEVEGLGYMVNEHGAHAVLASLWEVDDTSTSMLMNSFYKGVRHSESKAESLRSAEEQMLDGREPGGPHPASQACEVKQNPLNSYAHPHYWAPFILIGNWH